MTARTTSTFLALFALLAAASAGGVRAQDSFDATWYDPARPYVQLGTVEDGIYQVSGADLAAVGVPVGSIDPASLRLLFKGSEVPLSVSNSVAGSLQSDDVISFVGFRNDGEDEDYLYNYDPAFRSSRYHSLFSDTTHFWLTWGDGAGARYPPFQTPANPQSVSSVRDVIRLELDQTYYGGDGIDLGNPLYTRREGYYWARIAHNTGTSPITRTYEAFLRNWTTSPTDTAVVRVRLNSETSSQHEVRMQLRLFDGSAATYVDVDTVAWTGLSLATLEARISQDQTPTDGNLAVRLISRNDFGSTVPNNWFLDWIEIDYVKTTAADASRRLTIPLQSAGSYSLGVSGFSPDSLLALSPDLAAGEWIDVDAGGQATIGIEASIPGDVYMAQTATALRPTVQLDTPSDLADPNNAANYVIIRPSVLSSSAAALADYRASFQGGSLLVMEVDIQDVFDQFDFGRPTPIAIRRFVREAAKWQTPPEYLVLWGDALYPNKQRPRFAWEVPSFGNTASDGWFAMQNDGLTDWRESLAIGRIPVRSDAVGLLFVDKVADYESASLSRWQKNALYLVGGASDVERRLLQGSALQWAADVAGFPTALDTTNFFKTTADALDPTFKTSIQQALTTGASWLTYFGHSAAQTWEIVTEPPALFDNAGRLPMVLSLGCFTGNFATGTGSEADSRSFSEQLVLDNLNGSIGHWGASSSGTIGASAALSNEVHRSVFTDSLRILGRALRDAKQRYAARFSDPVAIKHTLQYGLIGDPGLRLSLPLQPEFVVTEASIALGPVAPIPADSNLTARATIRNFGLAPADSVLIRLTRTRPDRTADVEERLLASFGLERTEEFMLPIDETAVGEHEITVEIDPDMRFQEPDELNNSAGRSITVFSTGVALLEPADFGMVTTTTPELRVAVERQDPGEVPVVIQLSEDPSFSDANAGELGVSTSDLLVKWSPAGLQDGHTYYWRARVDDGSDAVWQLSRFTVKTTAEGHGWLQRGDLFEANQGDGLLDWDNAEWRMGEFELDVSASSERGSGTHLGQFVVEGQILERLRLGFGLLVIDGETGSIQSHTSAATYPNDFFDPVAGYDSLVAHASRVETGDYIFTRTRHLGNKDRLVEIADSVKTIFRDLGSTAIDTLTYQHLWIMFARKGFPSETREWVEPPGTTNEIIEDTTLSFTIGRGTTVTPPIGPAREWKSLRWSSELPSPDNRMYLTVSSAETGAPLAQADQSQPALDLSTIDAGEHPQLTLSAEFVDSTNAGTPQLIEWSVEYEPVAELAIDRFNSSVSKDTLQEGETLVTSTIVANLSSTGAPGVLVDYYVTNARNERTYVATDTLGALAADTSVTAETNIETRGIGGSNVIESRLRRDGPRDAISHNNLGLWPAVVQIDTNPPQMEITIDGEFFLPDPDPVRNLQDPALPFVDLRPTIEISVADENAFIPLRSDTTIVRVRLDGKEVPFSELSMLPAKKGDLVRLLYEPALPARDTVHTLVVEAFDASDNPAADNPYQVHFRTQTSVEVEGIYPYPNPMSASTLFAFRLRGADAFTIDDFRLRIYTINGRLVREFDLVDDPSALESGTLRIGWNKVRWDGRDDDGDPVATGVYLYRVFVRNEGETLEPISMSKVEKVVVIR